MTNEILEKLKTLVEESQLTNEELETFYQKKVSEINYYKINKFSNEFDKAISEQVYKQVGNLISSEKIYPVVEKIMEEKLEKTIEEKIKQKIAGLVSKNMTAELEEHIKRAVEEKIQKFVVIDEDKLYELESNQKQD
jgi:deoxyhypusine synthase